MRETSWYYISMGSSQPRKWVLKSQRPLGPEAYNIYMVELGRYKWYQSQSLTQMWESIMFGPIGGVCPFGHEKVVYMGVFVIFYIR